jgi:hypothetical protein
MNGTGNRALDIVSCVGCEIDRLRVDNANCGSGPDGAITIESDIISPNQGSTTYQGMLYFPVVSIQQDNTTCHALFIDSRYGENSKWRFVGLESSGFWNLSCKPNCAGSGAEPIFVMAGNSSIYPNSQFDSFTFSEFDVQDMYNQGTYGTYGLRFECPGTLGTTTYGLCGSGVVELAHVERIDQGPGNIGIGCTSGGAPSGGGCIGITLISPSVNNFTGGFYRDGIDQANLGTSLAIFNDDSNAQGISYFPLPTTAIATISSLNPKCSSSTESAHAVANNCSSSCTAGSPCSGSGSTHCEVYCNGTSWTETGR